MQQVDLLPPQIGRQLDKLAAYARVETVSETVGRVCAEYDRPVAQLRAPQRAGRADTGFADAALSSVKKYSHSLLSMLAGTGEKRGESLPG